VTRPRATFTSVTPHAGLHGVAGADRTDEVETLAEINRAGARQFHADDRRNQRAAPQAVSDDAAKRARLGIDLIEMGRIAVAGQGGEQRDIVFTQGAGQDRFLARAELFGGQAFKQHHRVTP
jgi:hypothetical protein